VEREKEVNNTTATQVLMGIDRLYNDARSTANIRHIASERLRHHHRFTVWSITILSTGLIVIPLLQALGVPTSSSSQALNAIQVFLAVVVLVFSLLLSMDNYSIRADKMHQCGVELSVLARKMEPIIRTDNPYGPEYNRLLQEYDQILRRYENHEEIDHKMYRLRNRDKYYPNPGSYFWASVRTYFLYSLDFTRYIVLFFSVGFIVWVWLL
jgi:hypothetical protein